MDPASNFGVSVNVISRPRKSGMTIKRMIDETLDPLSKQGTIQEHGIVTIGSSQAGRIVLDRGEQYCMLGTKTEFTITYKVATTADFSRLLPIFDKSAQTLVVH